MDANKWLTLQADFRYTDSKTSTAQSGTSEHGENAIWSFASSMPSMCPLGYGYATEDDDELLPLRNTIQSAETGFSQDQPGKQHPYPGAV